MEREIQLRSCGPIATPCPHQHACGGMAADSDGFAF
jgi:hypothetical protein